jgi:uncharacterized protein
MTMLDQLMELQELDTAIDQISHRRARLPDHADVASAAAAVRSIRDRLRRADDRFAAAERRIEQLERDGVTRAAKKARLDGQLKTVIAPREAEALMHEIALVVSERETADDEELTLLDEQESAMTDSATAQAELGPAEAGLAEAELKLAAALDALVAETDDLRSKRISVGEQLPADLLARYESMRRSFGGVAVARLVSGHCGACHLDLSRAFVDSLKSAPVDTIGECEQCGRMLVV